MNPTTKSRRQLEGIVIHLRNYGESHRIVELLTPELGRISLLARGARKSRRRFAGALDLFVSLRVNVTCGRGLWTLDSADILDLRIGLRSRLDSISRASLLCDCARALSAEHSEAQGVSVALAFGLDCLCHGEILLATRAFPLMLIAEGILPELERCSACGGSLDDGARIDPVGANTRCLRCDQYNRLVGPAVLDALRQQGCDDQSVATQLESEVVVWIEAHTGRSLRSASVDILS